MKVLFGISTGSDSLEALHRTVERARDVGDELTVAVLEHPDDEGPIDEFEQSVREAITEELPAIDLRRVEGHPGSRLVELAESENFDRIVLGGGEQSPMGKIRIGSIAEFVLLNSHVSVTLLR
ncbi:universal stress protein [Halodesulfurarchaeum sp. HSR-GB]|uniref:universal stress protein n=1 Tax=Halodesulfurarchaeum sp. HSR-GB TaxID=3074077 RepID=UPI00285D70D5|nr:universal stress protein [Halodesulfurarchaeum sp. HSR-GB]MDR5656585.1 universal stress protein [Halodesulfurarchaeum sp. HSR-GB]